MPLRHTRIGIAIALVGVALMAIAGKDAMAESMFVTQYGGSDGYCGQITASAEIYDCSGLTAASPTLPFGTRVLVCYEGCTVVRANDRCGGCYLDISLAAAEAIGLPGADVAEVTPL